eukprot:Tbor_TRINITY_DN2381_c0_g1::TRINITY_DN2381_c0_g1_i1::g.204::m.204
MYTPHPLSSSITPFRSLLDVIEPTEASLSRLVEYAVVSHLPNSEEIFSVINARIIERYRHYHRAVSGRSEHQSSSYSSGMLLIELRALWSLVDYLIKAAPLVYGGLFRPVAKDLVENYMPWKKNKNESMVSIDVCMGSAEDTVADSQWCEDMVYSWSEMLPSNTWGTLYHTIRNYRITSMLKEEQDAANGIEEEDGNELMPYRDNLHHTSSINERPHDNKANVIVLDSPASTAQMRSLQEAVDGILSVFKDINGREGAKATRDQTAAASHTHVRSETRQSGGKRPADVMFQSTVTSTSNVNECDDLDEDYTPPVDTSGADTIHLPDLDLPIRAREARRRRR